MNIYAKILSYIISFTLAPIVMALSDKITLPVFRSNRSIKYIAIHNTIILTVTTVSVIYIWRFSEYIALHITSDYLKVIIYTVILTILCNEKLFLPWTKFSVLQQNFVWAVSKNLFTILPLKSLLYFASTVLLVISQLQTFAIYAFSSFWAEFFSYHEYALLIVFSVNEIGEHLPVDYERIKNMLKMLKRKEILGFNPDPFELDENELDAKVYISYAEKDRKTKKVIEKLLKVEGIKCCSSVEYYNTIYDEKYKNRMQNCKAAIMIIGEKTSMHPSQHGEFSAALKNVNERQFDIFVYKVTGQPCTNVMADYYECVPKENVYNVSDKKAITSEAKALVARIKELA